MPRSKERVQKKTKNQRKNAKNKKSKGSPKFGDPLDLSLKFILFFFEFLYVFLLWILASWFLDLGINHWSQTNALAPKIAASDSFK